MSSAAEHVDERRQVEDAVERLADSLQVLVLLLPQVALQRDPSEARVADAARRALDDAASLSRCVRLWADGTDRSGQVLGRS